MTAELPTREPREIVRITVDAIRKIGNGIKQLSQSVATVN